MNTITPAAMSDTQLESSLAAGNRAQRSGNYAEAVGHYLRALQATPALGKTIATNLAMTRQKYRDIRQNVERTRVAVCGWELAHNAAGRVYTLAKLYETFADVEIIGAIFPMHGREVWEPIRNTTIPRHTFVVDDQSRFIEQAIELVAANPYDIVHLSKPRAPNIFFGILYKLIWGARVLVDIDDEELAFVGAETAIKLRDYLKGHGKLPEMQNLAGNEWTRIAVGLAQEFDGVTVSNPALQQRYGGEVIRHARDAQHFNPSPELKRRSREKFSIPHDKKVVLFFGTPREHKGLISIANSISSLKRDDIWLVIVGNFPKTEYKNKLLAIPNVHYQFIDNQPFDTIPEVTAIGDIYILLQEENSDISRYQIPAKLSDSFGMGLAVFAQEQNSLKDISNSGAYISVTQYNLKARLQEFIDNPQLSDIKCKGRQLFLEKFAFQPVLNSLQKVIKESKSKSDNFEPGSMFALLIGNYRTSAWLIKMLDQSEYGEKNIAAAVKIEPSQNIASNPALSQHQRVKRYLDQKSSRKAKFAVFTAITGKYDVLILPELIVDEWDYIIYTDIEIEGETIYEFRKPPIADGDSVRVARYVKTNPHILLAEYSHTLWIDGNVFLKSSNLNKIIDDYIVNGTLAAFRKHPVRQCMYDEINKCQELKKDDLGVMEYQLARYREENIPDRLGLFETNVIFRSNKSAKVVEFNNLWWSEIQQGSRRDQLSVMYATYVTALPYTHFPEKADIRSDDNQFYFIYSHSNNKSKKTQKYIQPDFYKVKNSNEQNAVAQKSVEPRAMNSKLSENKTPSRIKNILLKMYDLGFKDVAYKDLVKVFQKSSDENLRLHAGWQIILHDSMHSNMSKLEHCLKIIGNIREINNNKSLGEHMALIQAEIVGRLNGDFVIADFVTTLTDIEDEFWILKINFSASAEAKIFALNKVFAQYGLQSVRFATNTQRTLLDSISPEKPLGRFDFVDSKSMVTVIVPAFNAEITIRTTLYSLLNQTWSNLEIIVVDDCSDDQTLNVIRQIAENEPRIKVIASEENSGPYVARNRAIEISSGEFLTICDADDWNHPQKIETQVKHLLSNNQYVANTACWIRGTSELNFSRRGNPHHKHLNISSLMIRKKQVLDALGKWNAIKFGADSEFYKRIGKYFGKESIFNIDAITSIGRIEAGSLTQNPSFGYNGFAFGARREYLESYEFFHKNSTVDELHYSDGNSSGFPVPEPMKPQKESIKDYVDVVFADDFRIEANCLNAIQFIEASNKLGITYRLLHLPRYDIDARLKVHDLLRDQLLRSNICLLVHGEAITANKLIIAEYTCFLHKQIYFPQLSVNHTIIKINNISNDEHVIKTLKMVENNVKEAIQSRIEFSVPDKALLDLLLANNIKNTNVCFEGITILNSEDIPDFKYAGSNETAIVMPCINLEQGISTAKILIQRAGCNCTVVIAMDNCRNGFIRTLNLVSKKIHSEFICYVASDAYPGRNWLSKAVKLLGVENKGLLGFNDGKWDGRIASFGLVRKSWIKKFYGDNVLHGEYKSHKADNEITLLAKLDNNYIYSADSVLVEYDLKKDRGGSNPDDDDLFKIRFLSGFDSTFDQNLLSSYKMEYKIKD